MDDKLGLDELIEFVRSANDIKAGQENDIIASLLSGRITVFDEKGLPIRVDTVLDRLLRSLSYEKRSSVIDRVSELALDGFSTAGDEKEPDTRLLRNLLRLRNELFAGETAYVVAINFAQKLLSDASYASDIETRLLAAQFLVDADVTGDSSEFWTSMPAKAGKFGWRFVPSATIALLRRRPDEAFSFLAYSATLASEPESAHELLAFTLFFRSPLAAKISLRGFSDARGKFFALMAPDMRSAFESVGIEAGFSAEMAAPPQSSNLLPIAASALQEDLAKEDDRIRKTILGLSSSTAHAIDLRKGRNHPFVDGVVGTSTFDAFLAVPHFFPNGSEKEKRRGQLDFVRAAVKQDIEAFDAISEGEAPSALLESVRDFGKPDDAAKSAAAALVNCKFSNRPFYFLSSEYHQDRLLMSVAVEALRSHGLYSAQVRFRRWDSNSFRMRQGGEGHAMIRAEVVGAETRFGLYKYEGFSVFGRTDKMQLLMSPPVDTEIANTAKAVLDILHHQGRDAADAHLEAVERRIRELPVKHRARLALHLGGIGSKGSVFEDIRPALFKIAEMEGKAGRISETDDDSFEKFITGLSGVYCGGAINALLIQTWWQASDPFNFVKLITHDELRVGFTPKGRVPKAANGFFIENRMYFSEWGGNTRANGKAQAALVELFRTIGRGFERWANAIADAPKLNGQSASCQAARRILGPTRDYPLGRYAFVTTLKDPARLIKTSDRYYQ